MIPKCKACKEPLRKEVNKQALYCADPTCRLYGQPIAYVTWYEQLKAAEDSRWRGALPWEV